MMLPNFFTKIVELFNSQPDIGKMGFLTSLFKIQPDSFTDADKINLDMIQGSEEVAPYVRDLSTGAVVLSQDEFGNMEVPFPVISMKEPVPIAKLMKRAPGENSYLTDKVNWYGKLASLLKNAIVKQTNMIKRSMELQAAQILQKGTVTLTDENGNSLGNALDFHVPVTHFPAVTTSWGSPGSDPLADISALADVIRVDGLTEIRNLVFDNKSWDAFVKNDWIQKNLSKDGMNTAAIDPRVKDKGAAYLGYINYNAKRYDFWGYDARYNPFGQKNVSNKYLEDNHVLFLPEFAAVDLRRYFGGIPSINPDPVFEPLFGEPIQIGGEYDIKVRIDWDQERETYTGKTKSRPLFVPAGVLQFGCLTTVAAS
jgi:hypothetical protein